MGQSPTKEAFTKIFVAAGWCKVYSEKYPSARLYHIPTGAIHSQDYIIDSFREHKPAKSDLEGITAYVMTSLPSVSGTVFDPRQEATIVSKRGLSFINNYSRYKPATITQDISPLFLEYWERLFPCTGDRSLIIQWLAHIFQFPAIRPSWHLMLTSEVGTGKGFLVSDILQPLLLHTTIATSYEQVFTKHSTVLEENLLCLLDDPKSRSDSTMTKLKSALSEERCYVEHKNEQGKMVATYTRFILASNEKRPLRIDENERRWFAPKFIVHRKDKAETQEFIAKLAAWLALPGSLDAVYAWFLAIDTRDFNHKHVQQSDTLLSMIDLSRNALDSFFDDWLNDEAVFKYAELKEAIKTAGYEAARDSYLKHELTSRGFTSKRYCENKHTLWHKQGKSAKEVMAVFGGKSDF